MVVDPYVLALGYSRQVNLHFRLGQDIGGRSHTDEEVWINDS